jgi:hypothetical protein
LGGIAILYIYPDEPCTIWFFWSLLSWFLFLGGFHWLHNIVIKHLDDHYHRQILPMDNIYFNYQTSPVYRAWDNFFLILKILSFLSALGLLGRGVYLVDT